MEARVSLSEDVARQKGAKRYILEWIQLHPIQVRHTCKRLLGETMSRDPECSFTTGTIEHTLTEMQRKGMIHYTGRGRRRGAFSINYLHPSIPADLINKAPQDEREKALKVKALVDGNYKSYIDEQGVLTESMEPEPEPEPKPAEEKPEEHNTGIVDEAKTETEVETEIPVLAVVKKEKGGVNLSITLNINLN